MDDNQTDTVTDGRSYYEDLAVGTEQKFGRYEVTRDEVIAFAQQYDPQGFHLDDDIAAATHFGRISASGWHTCAMTMRMMVENMKNNRSAGLGSPGLENLRWKQPVFPGDVLRCETKLLEKRRSGSRPEMGIFKSACTVFNQKNEPVLQMVSTGLIETRDPQGTD